MRRTMPSINVRLISGGGGGSICRLLVDGTAEGTGRGESTCSRMAAKSFLPKRALSDRKSTRLNSSHSQISYAVFCLKKKREPPVAIRVADQQEPGTTVRSAPEHDAAGLGLALRSALLPFHPATPPQNAECRIGKAE